MRCAASASRCRRFWGVPGAPFFALTAALHANAAGLPVEATGKGRCLVQSARSVAKAASLPVLLAQPVPGIKDIKNRADDAHDFYAGLLTRCAKAICNHWLLILLLFSLGFGLVFPFIHWSLESRGRRLERAVFNDADSVVGAPRGVLDVVQHLRINRDGGLHKVRSLIDDDKPAFRRPIKVLFKCMTVFFNVTMLVQQDVTMLRGSVDYYSGGSHDLLPRMLKRYVQFTGNHSLITVRHVVFVALAELLGLAAMLVWIAYRAVVFRVCKDSAERQFDAFLALYDAFESYLLLSGFSALRLVNVFHPSLIMRQFQWHMAANVHLPLVGSKHVAPLQAAYFVLSRIGAVLLGMLAFAVKIAFTSVQLHMPVSGSSVFLETGWRWCVVIMLLQQTLGAIGIEHVMWWRMILLIVEGGDRQITSEKIQVSEVYLSMIEQRIYEDFWCQGKYVKFFLLMLTFDHADLQHLLIEQEEDTIAKTISSQDVSSRGIRSRMLDVGTPKDADSGADSRDVNARMREFEDADNEN